MLIHGRDKITVFSNQLSEDTSLSHHIHNYLTLTIFCTLSLSHTHIINQILSHALSLSLSHTQSINYSLTFSLKNTNMHAYIIHSNTYNMDTQVTSDL